MNRLEELMRNVIYIDVSGMTQKELCNTLGIKYVPWYKSSFFWLVFICLCLQPLALIGMVLVK